MELRDKSYLSAMLCSLLITIFAIGCSKEEFRPVYDVPEEYQPFIDAFVREASNRGYALTIDNLIIDFDPTIEAPHCAQCNSSSMDKEVQKIISINPNMTCWFTDEEREALIFHELGHCVLGRLHDNELLPNGDLKSVMNEIDLSVYSSCIYPVDDQPCSNTFKRPYYLDELFNENAPVPDWGN
jgi:hypothetical protein